MPVIRHEAEESATFVVGFDQVFGEFERIVAARIGIDDDRFEFFRVFRVQKRLYEGVEVRSENCKEHILVL